MIFFYRWKFTPTDEEKDLILKKFEANLIVLKNFEQTAPIFDPYETNLTQPVSHTNSQTIEFCDKLGIDDPTNLVLLKSGANNTSKASSLCFIPKSVEIKHNRLNVSLPERNLKNDSIIKDKLNMTLPAPKINNQELFESSFESGNCDNFQKKRTILSLPAPKNDNLDTSLGMSNLEVTSELSTSTIFSEEEVKASTPQTKKFKRRNQSIYNNLDDNL